MADLAPISFLTLDGISIQEVPLGIHLEITRGINEIPAVRGEDDTVSALPGRVPFARLQDVLAVELTGLVLGDDLAAYRTSMSALRALLAAASLTPKVLAGMLEDGATASINARVIDYQVTEQIASLAADIKVALESVDPDWVITPAGS